MTPSQDRTASELRRSPSQENSAAKQAEKAHVPRAFRLTLRAKLTLLFLLSVLLAGGFFVSHAWHDNELREASIPDLEALVKIDPLNRKLLALLGGRYAEAKDYPNAAILLRRAAEAGEKQDIVWQTWAATSAAGGDRKMAGAVLKLGLKEATPASALHGSLERFERTPPDSSPREQAQAICPQGTSALVHEYAPANFLTKWATQWAKRHPEQTGFATREQWAKQEPDNPLALRLWSEALNRNRRWLDAEPVARRAVELAPNSPEAHLALGDSLYHGGAVAKAGLEYVTALRLHKDWLPALRGLGNVALDKKMLPIGVDVFERAVKQNPNAADLWIGLGRAHYNLKINYGRALEAFENARRLAPSRTDYFADYSNTLRGKFLHKEAEDILRKRLDAEPNDAQSHYLLALILLGYEVSPERLAQGEEDLRKSLRLERDNPAAAAELGRLLQRQGKSEEAIAAFVHALERDPYNKVALNTLPRALRQAGRVKEADEAQKRWLALSQVTMKEEVLQDAIRRNPLDIKSYDELGKLYVSVGDMEKAQSQADIIFVLKTHPEEAKRGLLPLVGAVNMTTGIPETSHSPQPNSPQRPPATNPTNGSKKNAPDAAPPGKK